MSQWYRTERAVLYLLPHLLLHQDHRKVIDPVLPFSNSVFFLIRITNPIHFNTGSTMPQWMRLLLMCPLFPFNRILSQHCCTYWSDSFYKINSSLTLFNVLLATWTPPIKSKRVGNEPIAQRFTTMTLGTQGWTRYSVTIVNSPTVRSEDTRIHSQFVVNCNHL